MQEAVGNEATAVRSQTYYLDVTPPGHDKGTFVETIAKRLGISTDAVATIGDMENDLPMFATSGISFAMGNATDEVKKHASHVTDINEKEGFAKANRMNSAKRTRAPIDHRLAPNRVSPSCGPSTKATGVPFLMLPPSRLASQFVSRTQPWDSVLLTLEGSGVPWMPYPSADSPIQYDPTGLFGPGLIVKASLI